MIGGTIPGMPAVLIGRNADLGWGLTSSYLDDQDVYIERLNPDDPDEYLTPDGYRGFETREAVIAVRGAEPVSFEAALDPARAGDPGRPLRRRRRSPRPATSRASPGRR